MVSPERVTVNVNGVLPVLPSALLAAVAAIAKEGAAYTEHGKRVQFGVIDIAGRATAWSNLNRQRAVGDRDGLVDDQWRIGADLAKNVDVLQRRQRLVLEAHVKNALPGAGDAAVDLREIELDLIGAVGDRDLVGVASAAGREPLGVEERVIVGADDIGAG